MSEADHPEAKPAAWLADELTSGLANVLELMGEVRPQATWQNTATLPAEAPLLWREQILNLLPEPCIRIAAPAKTWLELGTRTLRSAGLDTVEESDARDTYLEILGQSLSGVAQALAGRLRCAVNCEKSAEPSQPPAAGEGIAITLAYDDSKLPALFVAFAPELLQRLTEQPEVEETAQAAAPPPADKAGPAASAQPRGPASPMTTPFVAESPKTLEMLLDLDLPVSVSFGHAQMLLSDILKLDTGSVIDLNRNVNEPVEVIVNNCVVATGEVVVVNGSFGVRIEHILTPEERLRSAVPESKASARTTVQGGTSFDPGGPSSPGD